MRRRQGWLFFILFLLAFSIYLLINFPFQLGLDLRGGTQLTLQLVKEEASVTKDELESVKAVLDRRVNNLGVSESNLQTLGTNQIIVELPGEQDRLEASRVIGKTALLEFRIQIPNTSDQYFLLKQQRQRVDSLINRFDTTNSRRSVENIILDINANLKIIEEETGYKSNQEDLYLRLNDQRKYINQEIASLFTRTELTGKELINAGRRQEQNNSNWQVLLTFTNEGGDKFAAITKSIAGTNQLLAIVLDGESISEASVGSQFINTGIEGGLVEITGSFTAQEAKELEVQLRGGALPLPIEIVESSTIGPILGYKNIIKSYYAAISGLLFVAIFMIINYRLLGLISVLSLVLYGVYNLALYALIPVTITLPGIAGLVLSIGMAVDANILIFERIRDELSNGNTLIRSIDNGFLRANSSIVDGHITTLISCLVLFFFGTNFVKGFSATLGIGVLISLFTSLSCTKTIIKFITGYQIVRQKSFYFGNNDLYKADLIENKKQ